MKYLKADEWSEVVSFLSLESTRKGFEKIFNIMNLIWKNIQATATKVSQLVISTAMIYFHKYYLINNFHIEKDIDRILICSSCLFIAVKSTNSFLHLDKMVDTVWGLVNKKSPGKYTKDFIKEGILSYEFFVLASFGFDCNWDLPYSCINKIKDVIGKSISVSADVKAFCNLWTFYINDSYVLPVCLYYSPEVIAVATLRLLCESHHIDIDFKVVIDAVGINTSVSANGDNGVNWLNDVEECSNVLRLIYKRSNTDDGKGKDSNQINQNQMKVNNSGVVDMEKTTMNQTTKVYFS